MRHRVLIICNSSETGTFFNLLSKLKSTLSVNNSVELLVQNDLKGKRIVRLSRLLLREIGRIPKLLWCDTVVFHSVIWVQFPSLVISYLLRRRIVVFHWDIYPVTIDEITLNGPFYKFFDKIEKLMVRISTRIIVPSEDFLPFVRHRDLRVLPLWPSIPMKQRVNRKVHVDGERIRLAFVGQANSTRGLPQALARLSHEQSVEFELHIFSPYPPEEDLTDIAKNVRLVQRSYVGRNELLLALEEMDFGLVSLHPGMGQPGFPSKTFDYIAARLPVIYTGRPLPAFSALLDRTGVGFTLDDTEVDWQLKMRENCGELGDAIEKFLEETELRPGTLDRAMY